jgi:hypothetical protein
VKQALTVFGDPLARIHDDPSHSERERREIILGHSARRATRQIAKNAVVVVLDPDVAAVFRDPKRVNSLLRATIAALKKPGSRRVG